MCVVAIMAVGGIGVLAAQSLSPVSGTQVLSRGDVPVEMIGVDNVGYQIWTGTGWEAALVGVKLSFTAYIEIGTYIGISVRGTGSPGDEYGYYAGVTTIAIGAGTTTTFYLWNLEDEQWTGAPPDHHDGAYDGQFPQINLVDHLIVTVAGNSEYVTSPV